MKKRSFKELFARLAELVRHRLLIQSLVARELKARYRGSFLGFLWSFLNPLLLMLVYTLVFSVYLRFGMENYHVFLFCGLLPWLWFSSSMLEGTNSIITGSNLVKKVLFPAEVLPTVVVISNLVHFILGLPILIIFVLMADLSIGWNAAALPLILLIQLLFTLGLVFGLSALAVFYRDIQQILGNLMTLWFFISPIIYSLDQVTSTQMGSKYLATFFFNPMTYFMTAYHNMFFYADRALNWRHLGIIALISIFVFFGGYAIFNHFRSSLSEAI